MKDNIQGDSQHDLNLETGKLSWPAIERHFARGVVIKVGNKLDLVEVASKFANDDKDAIEKWLDKREIGKASDEDAKRWSNTGRELWAIVAAPWVLVQEMADKD